MEQDRQRRRERKGERTQERVQARQRRRRIGARCAGESAVCARGVRGGRTHRLAGGAAQTAVGVLRRDDDLRHRGRGGQRGEACGQRARRGRQRAGQQTAAVRMRQPPNGWLRRRARAVAAPATRSSCARCVAARRAPMRGAALSAPGRGGLRQLQLESARGPSGPRRAARRCAGCGAACDRQQASVCSARGAGSCATPPRSAAAQAVRSITAVGRPRSRRRASAAWNGTTAPAWWITRSVDADWAGVATCAASAAAKRGRLAHSSAHAGAAGAAHSDAHAASTAP